MELATDGILSSLVREIGLLGEESSMSKDARKQPVPTDEAKKKFEECVSAMVVCGFGPDGPPVETTFAEIEELGHEVWKMVARALDEKLTNQHAALSKVRRLAPAVGPCVPSQRIPTHAMFKRRTVNPCAIARCATGIFFPQRIALKIDGRSYSPKVLETAMFCAARDPAYKLAAETLRETAEIQISARHLRNLAVQIGGELQADRDDKTERYFQQPLPRVHTVPSTPIALACTSIDGGRTQTRLDGGPNGVQ
ncbi:MAG: hypothetical protein ACYC3X_27645 [Pirellulaceae bacterium]